MKIRYLLDENLSVRVMVTLQRHYPKLDIVRVGDAGAPALGTDDSDLLLWLSTHQRVLITDNRKSMPGHLAAHSNRGHYHWGIFMVRKEAPLGLLADTLYVYWDVCEAEEWIDLIEWLPV